MKKRLSKILILLNILFTWLFLWTDLGAQELSFRFLVISDVHISNDTAKETRLNKFVDEINNGHKGKVDFLMLTGDNVTSYFNDRKKKNNNTNNRSIKLFEILQKLKIPYYLSLGNHDYKIDREKDSDAPFTKTEIDTMEFLWSSSANIKPYYTIELEGWKYIILNSMRGRYLNRAFDDKQIKMLSEELKDGKPALLFFHHPVQTDNFRIWAKPKDLITPDKEEKFFSILAEYKKQIKGIFVGHGHMYVEDTLFKTIPVFETATFDNSDEQIYRVVKCYRQTGEVVVTKSETKWMD